MIPLRTIALMLVVFASSARAEETGFLLKTGRLSVDGDYAKQVVSVENHTNTKPQQVWVSAVFTKAIY